MEKRLTAELAYWINERYNIKLRRDQGMPKPWTPDRIFQTVRFCNVHREDDKVTKWIREYWNQPEHPAWMFVLARMINLPETLEDIIEYSTIIEDPEGQTLEGLADGLKSIREQGVKIFTSAYTISTCGQRMDKIDYVMSVVENVKKLQDSGARPWVDPTKTCRDTWETLQRVDGLGSFLAAQVVADMKNTNGHPLKLASDWWTFSAPGPGSLRGLGWWFAQSEGCVREKDYHKILKMCREEVDPLVMEYVPRISNQDFQNCLCEFSKYCKRKYLGGHVRNGYDGT